MAIGAYSELIGVGSLNRRPRSKFTGSVAFDAASRLVRVAGVPTTTEFAATPGIPAGTRTHAVAPPSTLDLNVRVLDAQGLTYEGVGPHAFSMSGAVDVNNNGTIEPAESGVMLTGDLIELGFNNAPAGRGDDALDFRFRVTGGLLAPLYAGQNIGVYARLDSNPWPQPVVRTDNFVTSFSGQILNAGVMPIKCGTAIGDFVWHDLNANGIQDPAEPGINGVLVRLRNAQGVVVATTVTGVGPMNQQGYYQFTDLVGLCAGTWSVEVDVTTLSPGFAPTTVGAPGSNNATDSNPNPAVVLLDTDISKDQTLDFGFTSVCDGRIGNLVWHDLNRNGVQDGGEPGVENVRVNLFDGSGTLVATTTTSAGGAYEFTGLCPSAYQVAIDASTLPPGFTATLPNIGGNSETDSSDSPIAVVLTTPVSVDLSVDFGYVTPCTGTIGDFVFYDVDQNGVQDAYDPGIDGVTVYLIDPAANLAVATTSTGANGRYEFTGVCGGTVRVMVDASTLPPSRTPTLVNVGSADRDSNPSPTLLTLPEGAVDTTIDFGYIAPCTGQIGNFVWHDRNQNGTQDAGEAGIAGVTVNLRRASDNEVLQTDITGADGEYTFEAVCPGSYIVEVVPPAGTQASPAQQGGDVERDSNPNLWNVTLPLDNSVDRSVDFGFFCTGEVGDFVWDDLNGNGIQDAGEPGIAGVAVTLTDAQGYIRNTVTNASGKYLFTGLCAGPVTVTVATPSGYVPSATEAGSNTALDSNVTPSQVTLTANDSKDLTIDFGYVKPRGPQAPYKSFTQGGWGAKPSGNNPGKFLADNFARVYPSGITIGGAKTIKLTSSSSVERFLPQGSSPARLTQNYTNPNWDITVLAGQVLALKMNVDFSTAGLTRSGFGALVVVSGDLAGDTVNQVLALANTVLGGGSLPAGLSLSELNEVVTRINENFNGGTQNNGYLAD